MARLFLWPLVATILFLSMSLLELFQNGNAVNLLSWLTSKPAEILDFYLFAFLCSLPFVWLTIGVLMIGSWVLFFVKQEKSVLIAANMLSFVIFIVPFILFLTGAIGYCGP